MQGRVETIGEKVETMDEKFETKEDLQRKLDAFQEEVCDLKVQVHEMQTSVCDGVCIRSMMDQGKLDIRSTFENVQPRTYEPSSTPRQALKNWRDGLLGCLSLPVVNEMWKNGKGSLRDKCNQAAHNPAPQAAQRDAIIRMAGQPECLSMRLLYRNKFGVSVGTAAEAKLSRAAVAKLPLSATAIASRAAAEVRAEKQEADYFRCNPQFRRC